MKNYLFLKPTVYKNSVHEEISYTVSDDELLFVSKVFSPNFYLCGSAKLLNTDRVRIRIHNTALRESQRVLKARPGCTKPDQKEAKRLENLNPCFGITGNTGHPNEQLPLFL